jgi:adenosylcobinamide-phosphate synthase
LLSGDINKAREAVAMIVSRDVEVMDDVQVTRATIESVLENGNDAVFATLFWFFVFGAPGAVLLRLANTLDAMWGYRTERYNDFGCFAAKLDDALNWLPARLTTMTFALLGNTQTALRCWQTQAVFCSSPNGGPVMTAGAGSLGVLLGGPAMYHGVLCDKPVFGAGRSPHAVDIDRAVSLVKRGAWCWVALYAIVQMVIHA